MMKTETQERPRIQVAVEYQPKAPPPKTVDMVERMTGAAKKFADGRPHSYDEVSKALGGNCKDNIRRFSMQHWVTIEPSKNGYIFTLDPVLSAVHDANPPQPALGNLSAYTFLKNLRKQIIARREKDLADLVGKLTCEQSRATPLAATLNWIEDEFDKIDVSNPAPLYTTLKELRKEVTRKREEARTKRGIDLSDTVSEFSREHKLNPILDLIESTLAGLDINPLGRD